MDNLISNVEAAVADIADRSAAATPHNDIDFGTIFKLIATIDPLVDQFIPSKINMTIDRAFLIQFPILQHELLYFRIGKHVESLTLSNILPEQAQILFPFFTRIQSLILENVEVGERHARAYPSGVKFLKLSNCWSAEPILPHWLVTMKDTLESIHFDQVQSMGVCYMDPKDRIDPDYLFAPALRNIILERVHASKFWDFIHSCSHLETLKFVNTFADVSGSQNITNLLDSHLSLKTLELQTNVAISSIENILKMTELENVKIHCNWYHEEQLRNHFESLQGMKSYEIKSVCCAPTPGYDLLKTLNNECLLHIVSYLPEKQWSTMTIVHPIFISVVPWLVIDGNFLDAYPLKNVEFYAEIGSQTTQLIVKGFQRDFNKIIPYFKNLRSLKIIGVRSGYPEDSVYPVDSDDPEDNQIDNHNNSSASQIDDEEIELDAIPSVAFLYLVNVKIERAEWISFFRRLNPLLKRLDVLVRRSDTLIKCLEELHHLEYFGRHDKIRFKNEDYAFLRQNKKIYHLETGSIEGASYLSNGNNLRTLITICEEEQKNAFQLNRFTNLECLEIGIDWRSCTSILTQLNLIRLRRITILIWEVEESTMTMMTWITHFRTVDRIKIIWRNFSTDCLADLHKLEESLRSNTEFNFVIKKTAVDNLLLTRAN